MNIKRKMKTLFYLVMEYGVEGLFCGILNKLRGKDLRYGLKPKPSQRMKWLHGKLVKVKNLWKQYGMNGLAKGVINKLTGKPLLYGFPVSHESPAPVTPNPSPTLFDAYQHLLREPKNYSDAEYSCTVLIPIFNGLEHLERLLPSVARNTPSTTVVLLVDDASPDPEILPFVQSFVNDNPNWRLLKNEENYGFVKTVNRGMKQISTDYTILLNTDTMVPANWIPRMLTPFVENEKVATVTPFTNSGVFFSFPHFGTDNAPKWALDTLNHAFSYVVPNEYARNEIFSGTGFCMGINMKCWKEVGELDYENFGKGYGEENDWCFRAIEKGWKHFIAPNLFVYHFHGGSFLSDEKKTYMEEHQKILREKYSEIMLKVLPTYVGKDPWKVYRYAAAIKLSATNTLLYVDLKAEKTDVSGAVDYSKKELNHLCSNECNIIIVQYVRGTKQWSIVPYSVDPDMDIRLEDIMDLHYLFELADIKEVIVNNLAFCENTEKVLDLLVKLRDMHEFKMTYKFHDYLSVCPNFFLINNNNLPCDPMKVDIHSTFCQNCLKQSCRRAVQRDYLVQWRSIFAEFFARIDSCYFFSHYTKNIVCQVYPQLIPKAIVKYHEQLITTEASKYERPKYNGQWNFAFVGNFCVEKGSEFFISMKNELDKLDIKSRFVVIGENNTGKIVKNVSVLGRYDRENLGKLLTENEIHVVLYTSINNETFSYVAQELMLLSVPMVVFPCGAPQERIKGMNYDLGRITDSVDVESLIDATSKLLHDTYGEKLV